MQVNIVQAMAEVIRSWVAGSVAKAKPRLCCEVDNLSFTDAMEIICEAMAIWGSEVLLVLGTHDKQECCALIDRGELRSIAEYFLKPEGTVSFIDVEQEGGCTLETSINEDDGNIYSLLVVAWGEHEKTVMEVGRIRGDAKLFRGN